MVDSCRIKFDDSSIQNNQNCFIKKPIQKEEYPSSKPIDQVIINNLKANKTIEIKKAVFHPYFAAPSGKEDSSDLGPLVLQSLGLTSLDATFDNSGIFTHIILKSPQTIRGNTFSAGTVIKVRIDEEKKEVTRIDLASGPNRGSFKFNGMEVSQVSFHSRKDKLVPRYITLRPGSIFETEVRGLGKVKITANIETKVTLTRKEKLAKFSYDSDKGDIDFQLVDQPEAKFKSIEINRSGKINSFEMQPGSELVIKDRKITSYKSKRLRANSSRESRDDSVQKYGYQRSSQGDSSVRDIILGRLGVNPDHVLFQKKGRRFYNVLLTAKTGVIGGIFPEGVVFYVKYQEHNGRNEVRLHRITHEDGKPFEFAGSMVTRVSFHNTESKLLVSNITFVKGENYKAKVDQLGEVIIEFNEETYLSFSKKGLLNSFKFKKSEGKMKITLADDPTKELSSLETKPFDGKLAKFGISNGSIIFQGQEATGYSAGNRKVAPRIYNVNERQFEGIDCETIEHVKEKGEIKCYPAGDHVSLKGKEIDGVKLSGIFQVVFDANTKKIIRLHPRGSFIDVDGIEYPRGASLGFDPETGKRVPLAYYPDEELTPTSKSSHKANTIKEIYWVEGKFVHVHPNGSPKEAHPQKQLVILSHKGPRKYAYKSNPEDTIIMNPEGEITKVIIGKDTIGGYLRSRRPDVRYKAGTVLIIRKGEVYEQ
jgi:hypothetical protein